MFQAKKKRLSVVKLQEHKPKNNKGTNTYLLTPWSRVLLENLTGFQLVKKFSAFYGTQRFITTFTSARYRSLSWTSLIQSILPHPTA